MKRKQNEFVQIACKTIHKNSRRTNVCNSFVKTFVKFRNGKKNGVNRFLKLCKNLLRTNFSKSFVRISAKPVCVNRS